MSTDEGMRDSLSEASNTEASNTEEPVPSEDRRERWRLWVVLLGITIASATAFRAVLIAPFGLIDLARFDYWFFIPDRDSGALSVVIAAWLSWNRRRAFVGARTQEIGWVHWISAALVVLLYVWATWMRIQVQLIPILCALVGALAYAWGGRTGLRLAAMPCFALMLAFPPPAPLLAEIIWRLQGFTVSGANALLTMAGYATQLEGTEIRMGGHAFVIIEACSGWRGIQILSLVGLAGAELCELRLRRALWVVVAAVPLGIGLNILRACLVMLTQEDLKAEYFESHTPQGIAVLLAGTVLLYAFATSLRRFEPTQRPPPPPPDESSPSPIVFRRWAMFSLTLPIVLALISLLPNTREPLPRRPRYEFILPESLPPWIGTRLGLDYFFPYSTASNVQFHVDYRNEEISGGGALVDFFVAREFPAASGLDRMPDSKLLLPSNDWTLVSREPARVLQIGVDAERAIVSRGAGSEFAYVLAWRLHDRGLLRESLRSLLVPQDCERSPNECLRAVVRIVVPMPEDDEIARERAARVANQFVDDFVLPLKSLELI